MISIESIELGGFGDSLDEILEFSETSINLLEENASTKALIPSAVLATLYGLGQEGKLNPDRDDICDLEKFRPNIDKSQTFLVSVIFNHNGQKIKIRRDFHSNQITILDCGEPQKDITRQLLGENLSNPGLKLTGLSQEEFCARCLFISEQSISQSKDHGKLRQVLSNRANSASCRQAQSILVLDKVMHQYPYKSNNAIVKIQIEFFIEELKKQVQRLQQKISDFDQGRQALLPLIARFSEVDAKLAGQSERTEAAEYFKLCIRAAEIDSLVLQLRSNSIRINRIEQELSRIGPMDNFQIDLQEKIEPLWIRRASLINDYQSLEAEFVEQMKVLEAEESGVRQRWQGLQSFTQEQVQTLGHLTSDFRSYQQELDDLHVRYRLEEESIKGANLDQTKTDLIQESMRLLGKQNAEEAKSYSVLIDLFGGQLSHTERSLSRTEMLVKEMEEQRQEQKGGAGVRNLLKPSSSGLRKIEAAKSDCETKKKAIEKLRSKIGTLEQFLDDLATASQIGSGCELMQQAQTYIDLESQLKNLEGTEEEIAAKNSAIDKLKAELSPFYLQAQRHDSEITAASAQRLVDDINQCLNDLNSVNQDFSSIRQNKAQLDSWRSEIKESERLLQELFAKTLPEEVAISLTTHELDIDSGYGEFYSNVAKYHHSIALRDDLAKIQDRTSTLIGAENIYSAIVKLEQERQSSWQRIQELVHEFPEILEASPPANAEELAKMVQIDTNQRANWKSEDETLRSEIANFFKDYDKNYLDSLETLSTVQKQLNRVQANKSALELARSVLNNILEQDITSDFPHQESGAISLPLIVDVAALEQDELGLFLSFKYLASLLGRHRQIIMINTNRALNLAKFSQLEFKRIKRALGA